MTLDEYKIVLIQLALFFIYTVLLKQSPARNAAVFLLASLAGWLAQLPLGKDLNRYTPNITVYFGDVSLAVILTWGVGLSSIYAAHTWAARLLRRKTGFGLYLACGLPILVILEFTGSNIVHMKLYDYTRYTPLMGALNAMHAPAWLYAYYFAVAALFYFALAASAAWPAAARLLRLNERELDAR